MAKVLLTYQLPAIAARLVSQAGHDVTQRQDDDLISPGELADALKEYDAILPLLTDKLDANALMSAGNQLKIIANYAVGYDNIDVAAAQKKGIVVSNTPGILTDAVAEHTLTLIVALARRIVEADKFTRQGKYTGWRPLLFLGTQLNDLTLGIIGSGQIGAEVARRSHTGFKMNIIYTDLKPNTDLEDQLGATFIADIDELLPQADVISLHVPLLDSTRHLINSERLKLMKKSALLINTSRGAVIDEHALVQALRDNTIRGAALDVFEQEPELASGLSDLNSVIITPHIASATVATRSAMAELAAKNIIAVLAGEDPLTPVTH